MHEHTSPISMVLPFGRCGSIGDCIYYMRIHCDISYTVHRVIIRGGLLYTRIRLYENPLIRESAYTRIRCTMYSPNQNCTKCAVLTVKLLILKTVKILTGKTFILPFLVMLFN